jgi:uncharacterized membrane protein
MKIKEKLYSFLTKHSTTLYVFSLTVIIGLLLLFVQEIKHTSEAFKHNVQGLGLIDQLEREMAYSREKDELIDLQGEVLHKQRGKLEEASGVLEEQEAIIRQLINYLKSIKHWPPKIKPVDPDSLALGRSEA